MDVSQRMTNILNYYKENPGCDPNMFEFVGLCYDMVHYLDKAAPDHGINRYIPNGKTNRELYPIACAVFEKFEILSKQFSTKLLGNDLGVTMESPLYQLYKEVSIGVGTYSAYGDTPLKQKLGGVALYIAQQKRALARGLIDNFAYDNQSEMEEIQRLDQELHDPHAGGYDTKPEDATEWQHVESAPSSRQLLLEEIMNEYQMTSKAR